MNTNPNNNKSALQLAAKNIDEISKAAMDAFASPESFEKELSVAAAVKQLRDLLTPEVMSEVMALMNTSLGFQTDQDPKRPSTNNPHPTPYSAEVVRDVFIESRMRGFHVIGKEFTIIAGNFYGAVNGLERIVRTHKKVSNFRDSYEVPRTIGDGAGALVKCKAEWLQENVPQVLEREFAIRVNKGQGADAITGKAKRKLMAAVLSRLTGVVTPEGDAEDIPVTVKVEPAAATASTLFQKPAPDAPVETDDVPMTGKTPMADKTDNAAPSTKVALTAQQDFARFMGECGVSFDDFRSFCITKNMKLKDADSLAGWDDVPTVFINNLREQTKTLSELVKKFGKMASK